MRWRLSFAVALAAWSALLGCAWVIGWTVGGSVARWLVFAPPAAGLALGLARPALPGLPVAGAAIALLGYGSLVAAVQVWARQCWDCSSGDWTRGEAADWLTLLLGLFVFATLLAIALGAVVTRYVPTSPRPSP